MDSWNVLKKLPPIAMGVLGLLLLFGAAAALAADLSSPTPYNDDNYSEGFSSFYPHNCWRSFDTIYYGGSVWEAFVKGDDPGHLNDEIAVYLAKNAPGDPPAAKPIHYRVVEPGQTWADSDTGDLRRPNLVRFAVFKDKLFLYIAKTYDYNTGSILWQKQIDPIAPENVDGTRWNPPSTSIYSNRPGWSTTSPRVIQGLVVKVMNDTLYIFFQYAGTHDLYMITSSDAVKFSAPQKIHTFAGNDCLLNGDVVMRGSDKAPILAFLTKDDAAGGGDSTGAVKLWAFDPKATTDAVTPLGSLPGHDGGAGAYRDATLVAGDVAGCTPYGTTNLQIWGIGWGSDDVYHMQYVFNADGKSGTFDPTGIVDEGSASSHVGKDWRGYLASCIAPEKVTGSDSLQQYARVWWWGSTDVSNAHCRSLKYKMDLLERTGTRTTDTGDVLYSPAWVLQGVIFGLPPYSPNGLALDKQSNFYNIVFALSSSQSVSNSVTSQKTLTLSYGKQGLFGLPSASIGLSYSNAVQETSQATATTKIQTKLTWSPSTMGEGTDIDVGAQAWGIFFVPKITNEEYELKAPDGEDLGITLYYTYISGGSDLIDTVFDKSIAHEAPDDYWRGISTYPNSLKYWDPAWSSRVAPPDGTYISGDIGGGTNDYTVADDVWFFKQLGGAAKTYTLTQAQTDLESQSSTNTIDISGGAFGFKTDLKGALTIGSSTSTTFGQELGVTYGLPGWSGAGDPDYLTEMSLDMYLLQAKTDKAFWIPEGASGQHPWCLTWHVRHWKSYGATDEHPAEGPASTALLGDTRADISQTAALPAGLRTALIAKLKAAKAAAGRGDAKSVRNLLHAVCNQVKAQSGKAIPAFTAERWIDLLQAIDVEALMAGR